MSIGFNEEFDIPSLQKRLREMSDEKLLQFGRDAKYMCSPDANLGQRPPACPRHSRTVTCPRCDQPSWARWRPATSQPLTPFRLAT